MRRRGARYVGSARPDHRSARCAGDRSARPDHRSACCGNRRASRGDRSPSRAGLWQAGRDLVYDVGLAGGACGLE